MGYIPENLGEIYELAWKGNDWKETPFPGARYAQGTWMLPPNPGQEYYPVGGRWQNPPNPGQQYAQDKWQFPPAPPYPGARYVGGGNWSAMAGRILPQSASAQRQEVKITPGSSSAPIIPGSSAAIIAPGSSAQAQSTALAGKTNLLLIGGIGAAALAAFFIFKKKKKGKK